MMVNTGLSSGNGSESMITYGINKGVERVEEVEQLLPGIPDDITVNEIATKLPWTMFYTLSSVSKRWEAAVSSHQLFQARCFSQCTQTVFAFESKPSYRRTNPPIRLYSPDDGFVYHLPLIPGFERRKLGVNCQCVSLEGKLYALGGPNRAHPDHSNVHVFDLCGRGQWKPCASMKDDRRAFQCGVMNGKIYVFGGWEIDMAGSIIRPVIGCEVYDPVQDFWSPITSDATLRLHNMVIPVGEEFIFYNRPMYYTDLDLYRDYSSFADFHHPGKDQWRRVQNFPPYYQAPTLAVIGGKLHRLDCKTTAVYDTDTNVWTETKHVFNPALDPPVGTRIVFCTVVKNALFTIKDTGLLFFEDVCIIRCHRSHSNNNETKQGRRHSGDAESEHQMIRDTWQRLDFCHDAGELYVDPALQLMCPVQL